VTLAPGMIDFSMLNVAIDEMESAVDELAMSVVENDKALRDEMNEIDVMQTALTDRIAKFTAACVEAEVQADIDDARDYAEYANDNRKSQREFI